MGAAGIPWTLNECNFIEQNIGKMKISEMAEHLNRSYTSVKAKVKRERERISSGRKQIILWTQKEDDFLIENYKTMTSRQMGDKLGRNARAVQSRLNKLYNKGILSLGRNNYNLWTKEEEEKLKEMFYKNYSIEDIASELNKGKESVYSKIVRMRLIEYKENNSLSEDDKKYILDKSKNVSSNAISRKLKKSRVTIEREIKKNNKKWNNSCNDTRWTPEQIDYLELNWGNKSCEVIANRLKRSKSAVRAKVRELGFEGMFSTSSKPTLRTIMLSFGINSSYSYFKKKIVNSGLELIYIDTTACVDMEIFWKWLKENSDVFSFDKYDGSLCLEPGWFKEKVKEDIKKRKECSKNKTIWSEQDINMLISLYKLNKYNKKEIGERLGRTDCSIKCMITKLKREGRLK